MFRTLATDFESPGNAQPALIASLAMTLGESPVWDASRSGLWWVDIEAGALHFARPSSGEHWIAEYDEVISCVALCEDGGLIAGTRSGIRRIGIDGTMQSPDCPNPDDTTTHRFNDGRAGPDGRFWLGTLSDDKTTPDAGLYSWDGHQLTSHRNDLTISNGLAFSPDGRFCYHSDTPRRIVYRHAFDATDNRLGPAETWIAFDHLDLAGDPDGAAVDSNGDYWCALFGGSAIVRFDPEGRLRERYPLSAPNPTMCAFGGPDYRTLYITTAREGMDDAQLARWPDSGGLFALRTDVAGQPEPRFATDHGRTP